MKTLLLCFTFVVLSPAQERVIDYRFAPDYFHTPVGFPDDWQKTMVNERGALLLDFGPGPYVRANTIIGVGVGGAELQVTSQRLERGDIPIVMTSLSAGKGKVAVKTFAVVPRAIQSTPETENPGVYRRLGLTGGIAWAHPKGNVDPAFRNVAWGTNRPILYEVKVPPGSRKRVALGICESYRTIPGLRMMEFHVEGASVRTVDPIAEGEQNRPVVAFFDAQDADQNGMLVIETRASAECRDPNVILNGIWVFAEHSPISAEEVIGGSGRKKAEIFVDCGQELEVQNFPTRIDAMIITAEQLVGPLMLLIQSARELEFDSRSGVLTYDGRPFVASRPKVVSGRKTEKGWELVFPKGAQKAEVIVIHGTRLPANIAVVPDLTKERTRTIQWWKNSKLPFGRIKLAEKEMQHLFDASVRTLYQNRDIVDGKPNFQPGSTVYRGLWIGDAIYCIESAAMLGDTMSARLAVEGMFPFQEPGGKVKVMFPIEMQRETPMLIWVMARYARLTNNRAWVKVNWNRVVAAMNHIRTSRQQTLKDPAAPHYGLMPPGFVDGGIAGLTADYSSVFWALTGIEASIDMAKWVGDTKNEKEWQSLYNDLLGSFHTAARRDMRRDVYGNLYLPVKVADTSTTDVPQRAQWAICEPITLSSMFPPGDSLVLGSLALLDSSCVQGLPVTIGWMNGGIGVWYSPLYGLAHFIEGNTERAIDVLYAFANHATPHGAWAEEQMPKGVSSRTTGDFPTTSATAGMLRSVLYMLALERGNKLELLRGIPESWLKPGASVRMKDVLTRFGKISFDVSISKNGKTGKIAVTPIAWADADDAMAQYTDSIAKLELRLEAFKKAGFKTANGRDLPDVLPAAWGRILKLEIRRAD
ncbi:MAG: hypothetical protein WEB37_12180 [Bacteroidota bacterium]